MALLLTQADVEPLLDLPRAVQIVEGVLREQAEGGIVGHPPQMMFVGERNALRMVAGGLLHSSRIGVRAGPLYEGAHVVLLWDPSTGQLLAVMGFSFGVLRTGAAMAVAIDRLARQDSKRLALIGSGRNALSLLRGARLVRPGIESIRVFSRDPEHRTTFAARARADLAQDVQASPTPEDALTGADIVLVATDALRPAVLPEWIPRGAFVGAMGRPTELHKDVYADADLIVVGHKQQEQGHFDLARYPHPLLELANEGRVQWPDGVAELAQIFAGKVPGRTTPDQTIVFKESQGGYMDLAMAAWAYDEARRRGLGQEWWPTSSPNA
ncbi:MAG: ornithine cyclodeaminase family protein [Chloroflexi bacterium]|nr:ornithine cyclodeaminase family protein [Chloroflexota bacterium]